MSQRRVLMIGWHPSVVDYAKYPGLDAEKLEAALRADEARLQADGYAAEIGFLRDGDRAAEDVAAMLAEGSPDVVLIGAGVRRDEDHVLVFERVINAVHQHAPGARIAFNTGPFDSVAAVARWI